MSTQALPLIRDFLHRLTFGLLLIAPLLPASAGEAPQLPPLTEVKTPTPAYARYETVLAETRRLRKAQDFVGLEALAAHLRQSKETLDGGTWLLSTFYDQAIRVPKEEPEQQAAMDFYERWAKEHPESITAQVCLARALTRYAWNARGSGWANTVTDEGWRLFEERLARAWTVLEGAEDLAEKCPGWTEAAQTVALGQGWETADYFKMVDAAIAQEPTYGRYYTNACYYLFPRWYGETGDFEKWIAQQADHAPADHRDWQYARLVWMADRNQMASEMVFAPGRLDWNRTQRGFEIWLQQDPDNLMVRLQYLRLALLANDRAMARAQLDLIGGQYFPAMWKDEAQFEAARQFAYADGVNPLLAKKSKPVAAPPLDDESRAWFALFIRLFTRLCGGLLAGVLLLILAIQRQRAGLGIAALFASLVVGTLLGTLATGLVGATLWFYFRRQRPEYPPSLNVPPGWLIFICVAVIAPIVEELIFRGYAYSGWIHKIGFWATSLLSSVIFMACHVQYGWAGLIEVFFVGLVLCAVRRKTGSLYPCILLHALNNSAYYVSMLPIWAE